MFCFALPPLRGYYFEKIQSRVTEIISQSLEEKKQFKKREGYKNLKKIAKSVVDIENNI